MKRIGCRFAAAALAVALAFGAGGCQIGGEEVILSRGMTENEVFTIDGRVCTLPVMKLLLMNNMNLHSESYGIDLLGNEDLRVQKKLEQYVKNISMDEITRVYCMVAMAKEQEISLTDEELELTQWAGEDCFLSLSEEETAYLGVTQEELEDLYAKYALADKLYLALVQNVNEEVSDDEARVMELRQIFVTDQEKAKEAYAQLQTEVDFSVVAANYNEADEISVTLQRGMLPEEAEEAAFSLDDGETSELVETADGYYIFYCDNKYDEALTELHKQDIVKQRKTEAFEALYEPFVAAVESQLNETVWDDISIQDMEEFGHAQFYVIYDKYLSND